MRKTDGHHCAGCAADQCPEEELLHEQTLRGWRLMSVSVGFFLVPLILAVVGAACGRSNPHTQLAGAIAGLTLGTVCFAVLARLIAAKKEVA